jgi:hypothetical protein
MGEEVAGMGSPFPGVDPFLEGQDVWHDFHQTFIVTWRELLMRKLPAQYIARVEEFVYLDRSRGDGYEGVRIPDLAIDRRTKKRRTRPSKADVVTLEPTVLQNVLDDPVREGFIEVKRKSDESLVAVLELLSPTNKSGSGRGEYLLKRESILRKTVHLVELDLLLRGPRLPLKQRLPKAHYYAFISRSDRRPDCDVYHWTIRDPLPVIPIPLEAPDHDVAIDLQDVFTQTFRRGPFDHLVEYDKPIGLPLADEVDAWVRKRASASKR